MPIRPSPYWPYSPQVKQAAFLALPHREVLYGGSAGGGKSDALLMAALQYADVSGYKALLFRRTFPELSQPGGLIDRSLEWLSGTGAKWNDQKHRWTFPSGAILEFGYLNHSTDRLRYQGAELDFIGFDELTHFDKADYLYLFSRLRRREDSLIPPRMRGATNPGGPGHRWVKQRFIDREPDPDDPSDTPEKCAERRFIPAKLPDNKGVDQESYRESLSMLDPQTRAQLEDGDWNVRGPGLWAFDHKALDAVAAKGRELDELREAGELPPPIDHALAIGVDWGDFATHAVLGWELERGGMYLPPTEVTASRTNVEEITEQMLQAAAAYPFWLAEERYDASFAQSNRTFKRIAEQHLGRHNQIQRTGRPNTYKVAFGAKHGSGREGTKLIAIKYLRLLMARTLAGETTRILAISPTGNPTLLEQLYEYEQKEDGTFVKGDDDGVDALIALIGKLAKKHRGAVDKEIEEAKRKQAAAKHPRTSPPGSAPDATVGE